MNVMMFLMGFVAAMVAMGVVVTTIVINCCKQSEKKALKAQEEFVEWARGIRKRGEERRARMKIWDWYDKWNGDLREAENRLGVAMEEAKRFPYCKWMYMVQDAQEATRKAIEDFGKVRKVIEEQRREYIKKEGVK